jgi:hypothetical protein
MPLGTERTMNVFLNYGHRKVADPKIKSFTQGIIWRNATETVCTDIMWRHISGRYY